MIKYNWLELRDEFCRGHWLTVADFFRSKKIPNNSRSRTSATGWRTAKLDYQRRIIAQTQEKTVETEAEIRLRQQKAALLLQSKGLQQIDKRSVDSIDEARKLLQCGLEQEREALGINSHRIPDTQTNLISFSNNSELDRLLEGATLEEILGLIAKIKQEKERRRQNSSVLEL